MFWNGSTAIDGLSGSTRLGGVSTLPRSDFCRAVPRHRIDTDGTCNILQRLLAQVDETLLYPVADLLVCRAGQAYASWLANGFKSRGDIDAVAHEIAVAFLDDVAHVNPDTEFEPPIRRHTRIALDDAVLDLDRAADRVNDAAKLYNAPVAGAFDYAAVMGRDGRVDEIAAQTPKAGERTILVGACQPAVSDYVGDQDRRQLPGLAHALAVSGWPDEASRRRRQTR